MNTQEFIEILEKKNINLNDFEIYSIVPTVDYIRLPSKKVREKVTEATIYLKLKEE